MNYFNYFTEIEDEFVTRRGKHLLLSPLDWALIESWRDRGIPLHIVLRAIGTVFDIFDRKPSKRTIKGLMFCREEVEVQYDEWIKKQAGKHDEQEAVDETEEHDLETVSKYISGVIEKLNLIETPEFAEEIDRAATRLNELNNDLAANFEHIDGAFADIEKIIDNALLTKSDKLHLKEIKKEVSLQMKPYKATMEAEAYDNTLKLLMLKHLRQEFEIPRIGLYFL